MDGVAFFRHKFTIEDPAVKANLNEILNDELKSFASFQ